MTKIYYTKDHEWLKIEEDIATIGITNYAQEQLGELVFVDLPEIGSSLKKEDAAVVVESVKAASDVYAPVDGVVKEINERLNNEPSLVNTQPEKEGWLWKMELTNIQQLESLLSKDDYLNSIN